MRVLVNGLRLYFDVEGAGLVPSGPNMIEKPTLILLHGGPGFDHTMFKPTFSKLADIAQIIYLDHRGNGRSESGDPKTWNLAQWGDDVKGLCEVLGIEKPIVYGWSFGGFVAQSYATRHPDHPSKLILESTSSRMDFKVVFDAFERIGGAKARKTAENFWLNPTIESRAAYLNECHPLYQPKPVDDADTRARRVVRNEVVLHFNGLGREIMRMDFGPVLGRIKCPTLVLAGEKDPITPILFSEVIASSLPAHLVRFERFSSAGHGVHATEPERAMAVVRDFILGSGGR